METSEQKAQSEGTRLSEFMAAKALCIEERFKRIQFTLHDATPKLIINNKLIYLTLS